MASLMPLQRSVTPWKVSWTAYDDVTTMSLSCCSDPHVCVQTPPQIRPFSQDEFMSTLDQTGPQLTSLLKGDWMGLYRWVGHSGVSHTHTHLDDKLTLVE